MAASAHEAVMAVGGLRRRQEHVVVMEQASWVRPLLLFDLCCRAAEVLLGAAPDDAVAVAGRR